MAVVATKLAGSLRRRDGRALPFALCVFLSGCAALTQSDAKTGRADRPARRDGDLTAFEQKRDEAQYLAARDRADDGDLEAAETLLKEILERRPDYVESQLLLADLCVAQDRTAEAERRLRRVLERRPDHARARHSLGLLCDVTDRSGEAAEHFRLAAQAAPHDESYRLTLESLTPPSARE
jgi:predicted Zn-dependent protease